ncbi:MAG: metalloprotease [Planctomycetota bacterium]
MLLSEPEHSRGDLNFSITKIPVRVHWSFWLVSVLLQLELLHEPTLLVLWIIAFFVAILVHELGHAWTARGLFGARPWISIYGMGGLASYIPTMRISTLQSIGVSLAGPFMNFAFAGLLALIIWGAGQRVAYVGFPLWITFTPFSAMNLTNFLFYLIFANIWLGLFNLLPVYPLDGGQVSRRLGRAVSRRGERVALAISMVTAGVIAIYSLSDLRVTFCGLFFGVLAYGSYLELQQISRDPWRRYN